ncbi:hypothetical protein Poli38472_007331 [Pythium oligandrum]|uniref:Multiple inositol polyphosphate phosphatase 1 n=1 Tax=Pythium oligandrum TaxID=41045 RepID=A0A8K1CA47_PYTOL|nr:hypothetical protein Poli38472_007331 [Pythium oligandrum]|eukprot:TMW59186.1 hypothetical protein Poli38472_007331 [Pythium oligandrum]
MWRRSAILALFLALVASVDARSGPNGKIVPPDMKGPSSKDPLFHLETSMATKTMYFDLRTDKRGVFKAFEPKRKRNEESMYTLLQIQQVVRHGGRYPTKSNMKEIQKLLAKIQKYPDIPPWLKGYKLPHDLSLEGLLSPCGSNELQEFGTRVRKAVG